MLSVQFFEVVKLGRFRRRQDQVVIVEYNEETGGRLQVLNAKGEERRVVNGADVLAIEKADTAGECGPGAVAVLRYLRTSSKTSSAMSNEHTQTYVFDSEELRDAFVGAVVRLNSRVAVTNRLRGLSQMYGGHTPGMIEKLTGTSIGSAGASGLPNKFGDASSRPRSATVGAGPRAVNSRLFGGTGNVSGGFESLPAVRRAIGRRFFVMTENIYGFREPRVIALSEAGGLVQFFDSHETIRDEFALLQLKDVHLHSVDDTVLMLSFAVGDGISTTRRDVVAVFGTKSQRSECMESLEALLLSVSPAAVAGTTPWSVHTSWSAPLPLAKWFKFHVLKIGKTLKNASYVALVSPQLSQLRLLKARGTGDDGVIRGDAAVETAIGVSVGQLVVERVVQQPLRVKVSVNASTDGFGARSFLTFEFRTISDRELFIATMNQLTVVPATMPKHLLSTPVCSTPSLPAVVSSASLWGQRWPSTDIHIFVGSWNVSSSPPPSDLACLLPTPAPSNTPASASCVDMFVVGLQELGPSSNRDAWGAAIYAYLNAETPGVTPSPLVPIPAGPLRYTGRRDKDVGRSYSLVAFESLWELGLWVFVRTVHCNDITCVSSSYEATGISLAKEITGKQFGNKGGVAASFLWRDVPLCFVNSHFAARPTRLKERENDYCQITERLKLDTVALDAGLDLIHQHDHVFWFGDLNYRVELPFDHAVALARAEDWTALLSSDQLRREMANNRVFCGYTETPVNFPPTYRWCRDDAEFSNKNEQAPSYTDRILFRSLPGVQSCVSVSSSTSNNTLFGSDHRPVLAQFTLQLRQRFTLPAPATRHVRCAVPTFCTDADRSSGIKTPAIQLENLRAVGLDPSICSPQVYFVLSSALLEGTQASAVVDSGKPTSDGKCTYEWKVFPPVVPVVWDPRLLASQHLAIVVRTVPFAAGVVEDVLGQSCIPLAGVCDAIGAFVESERARVGAPAMVGIDDESSDGDPVWLVHAGSNVPKMFTQPGVPFSVPLLRRGQHIGCLEGVVKLICSDGLAVACNSQLPVFSEVVPNKTVPVTAASAGIAGPPVKPPTTVFPASSKPASDLPSGVTVPPAAVRKAADPAKFKPAPVRTRIRLTQPEAAIEPVVPPTLAPSSSPAHVPAAFVHDMTVEDMRAEILKRLPPFGSVLGVTPLHDKSSPTERYLSRDLLPSVVHTRGEALAGRPA